MVARIARLRIALLLGWLRGTPGTVASRLVVLLLGLATAIALAWLPVRIAGSDAQLLFDLDVMFTHGIVLALVLLAFYVPSGLLSPRMFAQYPAKPPVTSIGLLVTSPLTATGLLLLTWAVGFWWFRRNTIEWGAFEVLQVALVLITMALGTRIGADLTTLALLSKFARTFQRMLGALIALAFVPVVLYFAITLSPAQTRSTVTDVVAGLLQSPAAAPIGHLYGRGEESLGFGITIASLIVGLVLMIALGYGLLISIQRPAAGTIMRSPTGWFDALPLNTTMAIAARSLTYWVRDPRYRVSLVAIPVIPILVLIVMLVVGLSTKTLVVILLPLTLIMFGWMIHNDVASDSTAFWIHVASGLRGWQDRLGRLVPVFLFGIPLLLVSTSLSVMILDDWRVMPGITGLGLVALSTASGVSSIMSVANPYPTTRPHESPFVQPLWYRSGAGFSQTFSIIVSMLLTLPAFLIVERYIQEPELNEQFALLGFSSLYSFAVLAVCVVIGGFIYNRRSSAILAFAQVFD